jgi:hypothetical protein
MNALDGIIRDLEDELQRRSARGTEYAALARAADLPLPVVRRMVDRAEGRLLGPRRERDRRVRRATVLLETFEQRDERLVRPPGPQTPNHPWDATEVLTRLDRATDSAGQSGAARPCPVCSRQFRAGRADRVTCSDHCRDIARRIRGGDPTAPDAVRMLFEPPACAGCGGPLWARRPDAKHHGAACVKRAQRARWATNREGTI